MPSKFLRQPPHADRRRPSASSARGLAAAAVGAGMLVAASPAVAHTAPLNGLLATGARGSAVAKVQRALHTAATGHYRGSTKRAVMRFQRRHHLMIDGIVGPQTWDTLFHIQPPPPPPVPAATSTAPATSSTTPATSTYSSSGYSIPSGIVQCESGGNYSAVNGSSGAGGAYQILPSTWQAYGGQGLPQNASPAEQNAIAAKIYASQGASAWSC